MIIATLIMLSIFACNIQADTTTIEQSAFNYFIEKLDSITYGEGGKFNKTKNKIYFSGQTGYYAAMPFGEFRYSKKTNFIFIDTLVYTRKSKQWIYPQDTIHRPINTPNNFFVISTPSEFKDKKNDGDIRIDMTNRYILGGYYYIRIDIDIGIYWIQNEVYIKLDPSGQPVDWIIFHSVF